MTSCDECNLPAAWLVYAAYEIAPDPAFSHSRLARYPMPMIRSCREHLHAKLWADRMSVGSTNSWLVMPA